MIKYQATNVYGSSLNFSISDQNVDPWFDNGQECSPHYAGRLTTTGNTTSLVRTRNQSDDRMPLA